MHLYLMADMEGRIVAGYIDEQSARHDWTRHPDNRLFHYHFGASGPVSTELQRGGHTTASGHTGALGR
jgi:hypothetical protein